MSCYNAGVEAGLRDWRRLRRRNGHVAPTELCWRKPELPAECAAFWNREYAAICDTSALLFVRLYRRAKRAEGTGRADAQHENRGLTFWHEDDGTVVLHGRFPPEMGACVRGALDAAKQPAAAWHNEGLAPEDVRRGTSAPGSTAVDKAMAVGPGGAPNPMGNDDLRDPPAHVPPGTP